MSFWMSYFRLGMCSLLLVMGLPMPPVPDQPVSVPADQPASAVYLPMITSGTGAVVSAASSEQLIREALNAGRLDAETALLYRVYAAHTDARLPAAYRGDDRNADSTATMREVTQRWASLSPNVQALLEPFTLPPTAPGSWLEQHDPDVAQRELRQAPPRVAWSKACRASAHITVWYRQSRPQQAAVAAQICDEIEGTVWPKLTGLMGRAPLSDLSETNNGGDATFDIYLTEGQNGVRSYNRACDNVATYMLLNAGNYQRSGLAYSLMAAILFGYDVKNGCPEYDWNFVATAEWAKDYVYPDDQREHPAAPTFLANTNTSLDGGDNFLPTSWWGNYLWNLFLARLHGGPQQISAIWASSEQMSSLDAVNDTITGGFEQSWPLFTRANWNRDPVDYYQKADKLSAGVTDAVEAPLALNRQQQQLVPLAKDVPYLAARYYHYTFSDPSVRTFAFYNGFDYTLQRRSFLDNQTELQGESMMWRDAPDDAKRGNNIRALVKINGVWSDEDWTTSPVKTFCRSNPDEQIEELVLIFSNYAHERDYTLKASGEPSALLASNAECNRWSGQARRDERYEERHVETWMDKVVFAKPIPATEADPEGWEYLSFTLFRPVGESPAQGRASGTVGGCALSGSGSGDFGAGSLFVYNYTLGGQIHRTYWGSALSTAPYQHVYSCPNDTHSEDELIGSWFDAPPDQFFRIQSDGTTLGETFQTPEDESQTFQWLLSAQ